MMTTSCRYLLLRGILLGGGVEWPVAVVIGELLDTLAAQTVCIAGDARTESVARPAVSDAPRAERGGAVVAWVQRGRHAEARVGTAHRRAQAWRRQLWRNKTALVLPCNHVKSNTFSLSKVTSAEDISMIAIMTICTTPSYRMNLLCLYGQKLHQGHNSVC